MIPILKKLAEDTDTELRDLEVKWEECRDRVIEKYGREKAGTFEYVRTVKEFCRETGTKLSELSVQE